MIYLVDILNQIPTSLVGRAKPILDIMILSTHLLRWSDNKELVIKGDVVPDTNVPELIVHALVPLNINEKPPKGFKEFITCLNVLGLDSQYVQTEYAIQVLDQDLDSSDSDSSGSDVESSDDEEKLDGEVDDVDEKDNEVDD